MKQSIFLIMAIVTIIITSVFWLTFFHNLPISKNTGDWSNFGSYMGGVTGPLLSFISIILVLQTLKQTQKNHSEQIKLIQNEHIYKKFSDLIVFLENTINKSWISNENLTYDLIRKIQNDYFTDRRYKDDLDDATLLAIMLEATHHKMLSHRESIDDIVIIIRSLNKFIFNKNIEDKELMTNMVESKLTKRQRFIIYFLMPIHHLEDSIVLKNNWPTFWKAEWFFEGVID